MVGLREGGGLLYLGRVKPCLGKHHCYKRQVEPRGRKLILPSLANANLGLKRWEIKEMS